MNKNLFKIVFNASRGQRMAVAETAASQGKAASGEGGSSANSPGDAESPLGPLLWTLTAGASLVAFCFLVASPVQAQVIADRTAPGNQQPTVLRTASGVTQINIMAPSAAGVSRNTYSRFDVGTPGVILNNSRTDTPTQIGGYVQGNPWLATGGARVILNEVNSSNPSQIQGYVEVAGQRAEVIIANPAGIAVNGGGFLNASAVTLTTGTAVMNAGNLESFRVRGGTVRIDGTGLDTRTADYTNILARAVQVNAGIWAKDLKVATGSNDISAGDDSSPSVTGPTTPTGVAPAFALDVSALGGMYAGHIFLVGTEQGLGVSNSGTIGATAGDVVITNDGWLSNAGGLQAQNKLQIKTTGTLQNSGVVYAGSSTQIAANDGIDNSALIAAQGNIELVALGNGPGRQLANITSSPTGTIAAGRDASGRLVGVPAGASLLTTSSGTTSLQGRIAAVDNMTLKATDLDLSYATISASSLNAIASNASVDAIHADISILGTATIVAPKTIQTDSGQLRAKQISFSAHDLSNVAGKLLQSGTTDWHLTFLGDIDNTNGQIGTNSQNLSLTAHTLVNTVGNIQHAGSGALAISAQTINGAGGTIQSNGALEVTATDIDWANAQTRAQQVLVQANQINHQNAQLVHLASTGVAAITVTTTLDNRGGIMASNATLNLQAANLKNQGGTLHAVGDSVIAADQINNDTGIIHAGAVLSIASDILINTRTLSSTNAATLGIEGNNVDIQSRNIDNSQGAIAANQGLGVESSGTTLNTQGKIIAGRNADLQLANITGDGQILSLEDLTLSVRSDFSNTGSVIANRDLTFTTTGTLGNIQAIRAGRALTVTANNLKNEVNGQITGAATQINVAQALDNRGLIDGNTTHIAAETLNNTATGRIYGDSVALQAVALNNAPDNLGGPAPIIAARAPTGRLDLGVGTLFNNEGATIYSEGDMAIGGLLDANHRATASALLITNNSALIEAQGNLRIAATDLKNTYDTLGHIVVVDHVVSGSTGCGDSCYTTYEETHYRADAVPGVNGPGQIISASELTLDVGSTLLNNRSQMLAGGALTVAAQAIDNRGIDVKLNIEQRGFAHQRYTWTTCYPCEEHAGYYHYPFANDIADNQTVTLGSAIAYTQAPTPQTIATPEALASVGAPKIPGNGLASGAVQTSPAGTVAGTPANLRLPTSSLFKTNVSPSAQVLVETDPAFTNYRTWQGSDYITTKLTLDPTVTQKRLGDGFYEQRLIREQVATLTGRRFLGNYTSDEQQFQALMDAGVTYATAFKLRPGIALSAQQVAQLTSDIVWLEETTVTLSNGTPQKVLTPRVYLMPREGDLAASGALMGGATVQLSSIGDITNSGTIQGRDLVKLDAKTFNNLAGGVQGNSVQAHASQDINNIGGVVAAGSNLRVAADRDLNVESTTRTTSNDDGVVKTSNQGVSRIAGLYVTQTGGTLIASAGNDANLIGAQVGSAGSVSVTAGNNLNLKTVNTSSIFDATVNADNYNRQSQSAEVGSSIQSTGNTTLTAGNNLNARAATVQAAGDLKAAAGNSITLESGVATQTDASGRTSSSSGGLASSTTTTRQSASQTAALGSNFGGNSVQISSGQDTRIKGSTVLADKDVSIAAGGNVTIEAAKNTFTSSSFNGKTESGITSSGMSVSLGSTEQSTDQKASSTTAAASTVGSVGGNITITAGKTYTQTGSDVVSPAGNIAITAKAVNITEARETSTSQADTRFKQDGITVSVGGGAIQAAQTMENMDKAAQNTSSDRMKALAVASAALAARQALANPMPTVSASIGSSESSSTSRTQSDTARGSSVSAAGNTTIRATGDGQNSNLTIQGSNVSAGQTTTLAADDQIQLLAAASTATQTSDQKSSSSSAGISLGQQTGVTVSASQGSGDGNGQDLRYTNTQITGKAVTIQSGGDTIVKGAVAKADTVTATIGGNLQIESLQDKSNYTDQSKNTGGSVTIGPAPGVSINLGKSNIDSSYASVTEQSGIRAGDGGFNVNVQGNTVLKAGAITSTQKAIDENKDSFTTGGTITTSDIKNSADFKAEAAQISVGVGSSAGGSAGVGNKEGSASSTTHAAISGVAGNKNARTGDAETGIAKIFNADAVKKDINAQVAITSEFGRQVVPVASKFADTRAIELRMQGNEAEAAKWDEGGAYRTAMYGGLGALTGGTSGAAGAVAAQQVVPVIGEEIAKLNLPEEVRQGLTTLMGTTVGVVVGGTAGGTAALPQTALNYVSHSPFASVRKTVSKENARLMNQCGANCTLADMRNIDLQMQKLEAAGNLTAIGQNSKLTSAQAIQLGENLAALLPIYGTPIALYQAISGKSILSDQDLSTAERVLNVAAAAIPLGSAAYKLVTSAASDMAKMSGSIGSIQGFKSAEDVNNLMSSYNYAPAWKSGTQVAEATIQPGTKVQMVVDEAAYKALTDPTGKADISRYFGGWATFDNVPNQAYARNNLAITPEFKANVGYVIEVEVTRPINAQVGVVGRQGAQAAGGGNQLNFLIEGADRSNVFKMVPGTGRRLQ